MTLLSTLRELHEKAMAGEQPATNKLRFGDFAFDNAPEIIAWLEAAQDAKRQHVHLPRPLFDALEALDAKEPRA